LPLVFCRECGQEYYCVRRTEGDEILMHAYAPREPSDRLADDHSRAGYLYFSSENPWPSEEPEHLDRLPEDWVEERPQGRRVRPHRRKLLPESVSVRPDGTEGPEGLAAHFISAPFRFCLQCGVAYGPRQISDFAKVGALGSEGRSTATTILALSAIRGIRAEASLTERARKLLSFTDNRQDASLQAGHFNDFIEIGVLRAGLYRAVHDAGPSGVEHELLTQRVFQALNLPFSAYAKDPDVKFLARTDTERAFRDVLGYRLYRDLKRGWRVMSPNLEQCGLLEIRYKSLEDLAADPETWKSLDPVLAGLPPAARQSILKTMLDFMRRELAITVEFLDPHRQDSIRQLSNQRLGDPWAIDEADVLEQARVLFPRSEAESDTRDNVYLSARGGFGQFLSRPSVLGEVWRHLSPEKRQALIGRLLEGLRIAGIVERVVDPRTPAEIPGYQMNAGAMVWVVGDGTRAFQDQIRVPHPPAAGGRTNQFFVEFYRSIALDVHDLRAREHTAQVPADEREKRELAFREATLPILFCSPTMELGVDISELNVVNLRNVPPTPANYAQRSGRAGRSGQPALVFTYCAGGSPHDQYFFRRPEEMVAGAVAPPRLDLANEDLVRAHIHAIWLSETGASLGKSLREILDLAGDNPTLQLLPSISKDIEDDAPLERTRRRALNVLHTITADLTTSGWWTEDWLDRQLAQVTKRFDRACDRWRGLYRSALAQAKAQNRIIQDASTSPEARRQAERLRAEAESQLKLLIDVEKIVQSDFYSYRYFASEGFLPGYNFPRLPLSAYIPGRRSRQGDEFLSRPRFLAISEFGPQAIVYHEGSRYIINKVILPLREDSGLTAEAKICKSCGYLHPMSGGAGPDLCERCHTELPGQYRGLLRMQNVSTRRRDRINSDEEERLRLGYELRTSVRFSDYGDHQTKKGLARVGEGVAARLTYGQAATLWRINLGWMRRKDRNQLGFVLDTERGYWAKNEDADPGDPEDPLSVRTERVIPFVEDRRNCLLVEFEGSLPDPALASLQSALKNAIQIQYQLEESELAAEPLPSRKERRFLLVYESAEGGAGVLRRLVDEPGALAEVARRALEICHFDPETGEDKRHAPRAKEDCEAACYDCLLSYSNQPDHRILDRQSIREILLGLSTAVVETSPGATSRGEHRANLNKLAGSELERAWLAWLDARQLRLPTRAQVLFEEAATRPDFLYDAQAIAVYIDGPAHDFPERQDRDKKQKTALEDLGWSAVRFHHEADWADVVKGYPDVFGVPVDPLITRESSGPTPFDPELFPEQWQPVVKALVSDGLSVEPGSDVEQEGAVIGSTTVVVTFGTTRVHFIDSSLLGWEAVEDALARAGERALSLLPGPNAARTIRSALEGKA
jgi:very-short-patch-repair endonuclease